MKYAARNASLASLPAKEAERATDVLAEPPDLVRGGVNRANVQFMVLHPHGIVHTLLYLIGRPR